MALIIHTFDNMYVNFLLIVFGIRGIDYRSNPQMSRRLDGSAAEPVVHSFHLTVSTVKMFVLFCFVCIILYRLILK